MTKNKDATFFQTQKDGSIKSVRLSDFIDALMAYVNKDNPFPVKITAQFGSKYVKIVVENSGSRYVHSFIDLQGNIYKSASWRAPAKKHIRGSIFDENFSIGKALTKYGAAYLC